MTGNPSVRAYRCKKHHIAQAGCAECGAGYARVEERVAERARAWFARNPKARPLVRSVLPVEMVIAAVSDADQAGILDMNAEGRDLVGYILAGGHKSEEPTLGQLVRGIDAARKVRP